MNMTIEEFFTENRKAAIAFSGGVDSAYLLYEAKKAGAGICAYYAKTAFQPKFELDDAIHLAEDLGVQLRIVEADVLSSPLISQNPPERCYYCKRMILSAIMKAALSDGFTLLLDGTNASDDISDRPGTKALEELGVLSPLRICGLGKEEIRERSREAGLFTWDKPAYACLATRITSGEPISDEKLRKTESAEDFLRSLGFIDFRVRLLSGCARIQIRKDQIPLLMEKRDCIVHTLKRYYKSVLLDLEARDV